MVEEQGYEPSWSAALVSVAGVLALLIPPRNPFIIYWGVTETPVGSMFLAGILPGILLVIIIFSIVRLESCMVVIFAPEGRTMVAGAFMPRIKRIFHHVAQRRDDAFSLPRPGDESPGYYHPVPPGHLPLAAKT